MIGNIACDALNVKLTQLATKLRSISYDRSVHINGK